MNESQVLNNILSFTTPNQHQMRQKALKEATLSILNSSALTVTDMGRNMMCAGKEKHRIKKSDRLLSNRHLQREIPSIYAQNIALLCQFTKQLVIHVDWSDLDNRQQHFLVRASLAFKGRAITLYEEIHTLKTKEKPSTHRQFLARLHAYMPEGVRPIIVTDAGFKNPWFRMVLNLGWDYIGRVRGLTLCKTQGRDDWQRVKTLYPSALKKTSDVGESTLAKSSPLSTRLVLKGLSPKGRKHLTNKGERSRRSKQSKQNAKRESEPWLLATSLSPAKCSADKISKLYATRMQIEESFRDLKTGLRFNRSGTRKLDRLKVLLLIACLAELTLLIIGLATIASKKHHQYQANSIKSRTVLSVQYIALRVTKDRHQELTKSEYALGVLLLKEILREHHIC